MLNINRSERADEESLADFMGMFNKISKTPYDVVKWRSVDREGSSIYHTNVV